MSGCFLGFLVNVDSTILKVKLDHGFKIEAIPRDNAIELRTSLEECSKWDAIGQMQFEEYKTETEDIYIIKKSFRYEDEEKGLSILIFVHQYIQYLENVLKLMLLFKEGGIYMSKYYIRLDPRSSPSGSSVGGIAPVYSLQKFTLNDSEISELETFLRKTVFPFNKPFIQLAFDALIKSYTFPMRDRALSFILLITSLEILFSDNLNNRGKDKIIAKRVSAIIGGSVKEKRKMRDKIVKLYKKRSNIIHDGDFNKADISDLEKVRYYVRECIKKAIIFDLTKEELIRMLAEES